jgi:hypothetical protein
MTACTLCGGYGNRHDPIAHGNEPFWPWDEGYDEIPYDRPCQDCDRQITASDWASGCPLCLRCQNVPVESDWPAGVNVSRPRQQGRAAITPEEAL